MTFFMLPNGTVLGAANVKIVKERGVTNILFVTSSPRGAASHSSQVAEKAVQSLLASHPGATLVRRDVGKEPLSHVGEAFLGALFTPEESRTAEQQQMVALSDQLIDEVFAADIVVIATAMINFTVPSTLKSWLDYVARSGKTFRYTEAGPEGLLTGKRVVIVEAKGGIYSSGPMKAHDYQQPYLRFILGFLGMTDIAVIEVEGVAFGEEATERALAAAATQANNAVRAISEARAA